MLLPGLAILIARQVIMNVISVQYYCVFTQLQYSLDILEWNSLSMRPPLLRRINICTLGKFILPYDLKADIQRPG